MEVFFFIIISMAKLYLFVYLHGSKRKRIMKKAFNFTLACLLFVLSLTGCKKSNDSYYIRYEVAAKSTHYETAKIEVETDMGEKTISLTINPSSGTYYHLQNCVNVFSEQFGPVPKGFIASINASIPNASSLTSASLEVAIYVSRNNEPFVLKASNSGSTSCNTSYTIDY